MSVDTESLGIIAGNRSLPLLLARQARSMGVRRIVAVAFEGETDPAIAECADHVEWVRVGQLSRLIKAFTRQGISRCAMAGQINPRSLFDIRPDLRAMSILLRLRQKNAHTIFGAVADELDKAGIRVVEALPWLEPLMPTEGFRLGPTPSPEQWEDVRFGFHIAKEVSRLEIGQTVVVKGGTVLAVEGFEGTDRCLERGGELAGKDGGGIAVKVAKARHDMRFDIPCIGPKTFECAAGARLSVVAFEAKKTLLLEEDQVRKIAEDRGLTALAYSGANEAVAP